MIDAIGERMKEQYEVRTRTFLPRRTYTIIRLDGVAFHTYTKGMKRPYDEGLISDMNETARFLCEKIQGIKFGYVQSDEISLLLTDFERNETNSWFDSEVQKMVSVSAAMATAKFNHLRIQRLSQKSKGLSTYLPQEVENMKLAFFDSRVYTIPDPIEVANYFTWRGADCTRNSITMAAQTAYSHKELEGKSSNEKQEMLFKKGINWNDYPVRFKRGGFITKNKKPFYRSEMLGMIPTEALETESGKLDDTKILDESRIVIRNIWECVDPPIFTQDKEFLYDKIPVIAHEIMSLTEVLKRTANINTSSENEEEINHLS